MYLPSAMGVGAEWGGGGGKWGSWGGVVARAAVGSGAERRSGLSRIWLKGVEEREVCIAQGGVAAFFCLIHGSSVDRFYADGSYTFLCQSAFHLMKLLYLPSAHSSGWRL
jgi:hypothetical protein